MPPARSGPPRSGSAQEALTKLLTAEVTLVLVNSVVVIEDDQSLREMLSSILSANGCDVVAFGDGETAVADQRTIEAGLAIIDVGLPGMDGLDVCRRLRLHGRTAPVMMLTARHEVHDRVRGLDAGADDYLVKPFALDELLARMRALLRRADMDTGGPLVFDDLVLDDERHEVRRGDRVIELTRTEFQILRLLMQHPGTVLDRTSMYSEIWGYEVETSSKALDVHTRYVRRKLEEEGGPRLIHTVHGVGYVLRRSDDS